MEGKIESEIEGKLESIPRDKFVLAHLEQSLILILPDLLDVLLVLPLQAQQRLRPIKSSCRLSFVFSSKTWRSSRDHDSSLMQPIIINIEFPNSYNVYEPSH